jgi:hypothetical protein
MLCRDIRGSRLDPRPLPHKNAAAAAAAATPNSFLTHGLPVGTLAAPLLLLVVILALITCLTILN